MNQNQYHYQTVEKFVLDEKLDRLFYENELPILLKEIEKGLVEESSIPLLNSRVTTKHLAPEQLTEPQLVIDAGGTNLRVVEVRFENEKPEIVYLENYSMPGSSKVGSIIKEDFFKQLVDYVKPILKNHSSIQFCFSYPTQFNEKNEAIVKDLSKEIDIVGLSGTPICTQFLKELHRQGFTQIKKIIILNDTTATLLAGKLVHPDAEYYLGVVLGTGFNLAYEESLDPYYQKMPFGQVVINTESGNYDKFHMTEFDIKLAEKSVFPKEQLLEKKLSGQYFGNCFLESVKLFFEKNNHLSERLSFVNNQSRLMIDDFPTQDMSLLLEDEKEFKSKYKLEDDIDFIPILQEIAGAHIQRAAIITATVVAGFVLRSLGVTQADLQSSPLKWEHPKKVCINLDGSVINQMKGLRKQFEIEFSRLLEGWLVDYSLVTIDKSPILGSTIANY